MLRVLLGGKTWVFVTTGHKVVPMAAWDGEPMGIGQAWTVMLVLPEPRDRLECGGMPLCPCRAGSRDALSQAGVLERQGAAPWLQHQNLLELKWQQH